jgi:hypothetical protein
MMLVSWSQRGLFDDGSLGTCNEKTPQGSAASVFDLCLASFVGGEWTGNCRRDALLDGRLVRNDSRGDGAEFIRT